MTGMAFFTNLPISNRLKKIQNIERLFSFMNAENVIWLTIGPVIIARVKCDSPSEPILQPKQMKFHDVGFVSATNPQKYKSTRWFRAVIDTAAITFGAASVVAHSSGKTEFIVRHYAFPSKQCTGCWVCKPKGMRD